MSRDSYGKRLRGDELLAMADSLPPLFGRTRELEELSGLIASGRRLVVVSGPAGSGKSRLAVEFARTRRAEFTGGVRVVERCAADREREDLVSVFPDDRTGPELLIVDNHDSGRRRLYSELRDLLSLRPNLTVLVTGRQGMGFYGERLFPLHPLPLPEKGREESVPASPAVQLLADRAGIGEPAHSLDRTDLAALVEVSRALDGLPLAIEFAAPWLRILGARALRNRLRSGIDILSSSDGFVSMRHSSMSDALRKAYDPLPEGARELLLRLSCEDAGAEGEPAELGRAASPSEHFLRLLVEKHLVQVEQGPGGRPRFTLFNTTRMFARAVLEEKRAGRVTPLPSEEGAESHPKDFPLTPRQSEVARLIAGGLTNREISKRLAISEWTAINHVREVMRRLDCSSRVQVAQWAVAHLSGDRGQLTAASAPASRGSG